MPQRVLEPGQIETLAQRSIPRVRLPDRSRLFARRAERLRTLANGNAIGDYLTLMAALADAQQSALDGFTPALPDAARIELARTHRMPPILATGWNRDERWRDVLRSLVATIAAQPGMPPSLLDLCKRLGEASVDWIDAQANALLARADTVDIAAGPFLMAALQVHWAALTAAFAADRVEPLDVSGVCPLCGTPPVASLVCAQSPYQGYRYLHCALCATEWHRVRVECTHCGAVGKDVGYHTLQPNDGNDDGSAAVRAESCEACKSYRKILYQEKDPGVEPVADDLATIALDLLLGEHGYHRASGNPLLWQASED